MIHNASSTTQIANLECPLHLCEMFHNVEVGFLKSFYQPDHQVHTTRYGNETAALRQSRKLAISSLLQLDVLIVPKCDANFNETQPRPRKTNAKKIHDTPLSFVPQFCRVDHLTDHSRQMSTAVKNAA